MSVINSVLVEELKELKQLLDEGIITEKEFTETRTSCWDYLQVLKKTISLNVFL